MAKSNYSVHYLTAEASDWQKFHRRFHRMMVVALSSGRAAEAVRCQHTCAMYQRKLERCMRELAIAG